MYKITFRENGSKIWESQDMELKFLVKNLMKFLIKKYSWR